MHDTILEAKNLKKIFPGVVALDNVSFDLRAGEVHILVGENGAGKSTLAKCLLGAYIPEQGELSMNNETVKFTCAKDALERGITAVYQEFTLVPYLNVVQNIFLNREYKNNFGLLDHKKMEVKAIELLKSLNCHNINIKATVKSLSVAQQQMVEIAKTLSFSPRIIVFDEPTATLSEREVDSLFERIHDLKKAGIGIIYVSHRMQEFARIGDRITVLRDGKYIDTVGIEEKTQEELVNMMVGRDISQVYKRTETELGDIALETVNLSDKLGKVSDVSITIKKGEIVGIAGLVGAGRTELARLIFGVDAIGEGKVLIHGQEAGIKSPVHAVKNKIGLVPEDRKRTGLSLIDSIEWNVVGASLKKFFPKVFVNKKKIHDIALNYKEQLRIASPDVTRACRMLSGGNQQKVVLAKWLSCDPDVMIFDEPTRGIDVGAKLEIYSIMDKLATQGKAILMISSELPEVIGMSDRIYIMRDGKIAGHVERKELEFDQGNIAGLMLGIGGV